MRRIARIDSSIGFLQPRPSAGLRSPYLCVACRTRTTSSFSTSTFRADRKTSTTDRIRQRIWGTDSPPGAEDPYGGKSILEDRRQRQQEKEKIEEETDAKTTPTVLDTPYERTVNKSAELDSSYQPAETWDGLEEVGDLEPEDYENPFQSFTTPIELEMTADVVTYSLHRAMVEVFTAQQAGKPLSIVSQTTPSESNTEDVQITPSVTGAVLQFSETASLEQIIQSLSPGIDETVEKGAPTESEEDVAADRSTVDPLHDEGKTEKIDETVTKEAPTESEEDVAADRSTVDPLKDNEARTYEDVIASWDPSWLQISLQDPEVKFAVLKRTMQLTGIRIPDSVISSANTAKALLTHLIKPPKPRKLVEALAQKEELVTLPNVHVYPRRQTPVDKEVQVGRWKVIEKELRERGLPILSPSETHY